MLKPNLALGLALLLANGFICRADPTSTISGIWEWQDSDSQDGKSKGTGIWFLFEPMNDIYFGRIIKMPDNPERPLPLAKCQNSNNPTALGLITFYNLKKRDGHNYYDGNFVDIRRGVVYKIWLRAEKNKQELHFRDLNPDGSFNLALVPAAVLKRLPDNAVSAKDIPKAVACD
jgi:hypothetical protein